MRTHGWRFVRTVIVLVSLIGAAMSFAGEKVQLISLNHVWRYDGSGTNHETAWRAPDFDDSAWQSGAAPLGYDLTNQWGMAVATQIPGIWVPAPPPWGMTYRVTAYFRTTFQYEPAGPSWMVITNFIDDGAVVYLNGTELTRLRMPATNPITYLTYASENVVEGQSDVWLFRTDILSPGTNYLAVEIHNAHGEDTLLAMSLQLFEPEPPQIVAGPSSVRVDEGARSSLQVQAAGEFLQYQWYHDGAPVPSGTNAVLEFARTSLADAGEYIVVVSNPAGPVSSAASTLTVTPDHTPPLLVRAVWNQELQRTFVTFSELMSEEPLLNSANYSISNELGSVQPVQVLYRSTGSAGDGVVLQHATPTFGPRYWLLANNLTDAAASANPIAPGAKIPIAMSQMLVPTVSRWSYNDTGTAPANWAQPDFDDTGWSNGLALLHDENGTLPGPKNTRYREGPTTYYFRHAFESPATPNGHISVRVLADDGVVVYLNGAELFRRRMPYGPVSSTTLATTEVNDGFWDWSYDFPGALLRRGTNVIAAEVHQNHPASSDSSFGLELSHMTELEPVYTTRLSIERAQGALVLRWRAPGLTLETAPKVDGPWWIQPFTPPPFGSPSLVIQPQLDAQFFRLKH